MQYVGRALGSVSKTWSSINPSTLSGAIDVIVVEQPDGTLACSPFHVRFGKFQILKPSQKKVEVIVNDKSTNIPMKLSESGEAYFVFETGSDLGNIPSELLASPVLSATSSPPQSPRSTNLDANMNDISHANREDQSIEHTSLTPLSNEEVDAHELKEEKKKLEEPDFLDINASPDSKPTKTRLFQENLTRKLTQIHIPSKVENNGDLLLDIEGYKPNQNMMHDTDMQLKQLLKDELGNESDISNFIKEDNNGNIRIVNPYENGLAADLCSSPNNHPPHIGSSEPNLSFHPSSSPESMESVESVADKMDDLNNIDTSTTTATSTPSELTEQNLARNEDTHFIRTIRLTSEQLRCLDLKYGENDLKFSIDHGKAIVRAKLFVWRWDVPIVISDIDGTITKSDALGHVLAMIGKDWTHIGVAKLFSEIARNGYNILYLTARGAGQADSTRSYLRSIYQNKNSLPVGPVILSPDRTMAALRREVILKKPEVFKIACLNDIRSLYFDGELEKNKDHEHTLSEEKNEQQDPVLPNPQADEKPTPFFAGFGNRITDALSYRTVGIPSSRIFTINPEGDVHMELLELAGYRSSYIHINELVDHFFPPVNITDDELRSVSSFTPGSPGNNTLDNLENGSNMDTNKSFFRSNQEEKFTDANFWREPLLDLDDLSDISVYTDVQENTRTDNKKKTANLESKEPNINRKDQSVYNHDQPISTPKKSLNKTKEDIGKQIYLELGSPLTSPKMSSIDTTNVDNRLKRLSLSRPALPISGVSKVNVLDDIHSIDDGIQTDNNAFYASDEDEDDDNEDDDEFDEDEFMD
ncbi:phosphatidate phosphatase PAH1 NDAI_0H03210 [Naumovozyma dairenensis CBS 421]|uniref:LNS2/PITP domain-containing protein n=1 Tax=Naumovozyma dairenensis (strain ATCC 10597 / BCRC 20456 / CBS 421 / NBRC 0211 / NRRL Y-12639) TaxID=1071378 RepID=G0WFD3_NAUDC|nr:hypothetical protein NDAI_0H03210 [Naumovozyma dairenensis CBS 421]CCD26494.1 hypothetical protein NDAI_0H03210 [Naumovozyma dairenensis CBS 421]